MNSQKAREGHLEARTPKSMYVTFDARKSKRSQVYKIGNIITKEQEVKLIIGVRIGGNVSL